MQLGGWKPLSGVDTNQGGFDALRVDDDLMLWITPVEAAT
jgi:hypothetical protein